MKRTYILIIFLVLLMACAPSEGEPEPVNIVETAQEQFASEEEVIDEPEPTAVSVEEPTEEPVVEEDVEEVDTDESETEEEAELEPEPAVEEESESVAEDGSDVEAIVPFIAQTGAEASIVRTTDWVKGATDPEVTIIEYGDFQ